MTKMHLAFRPPNEGARRLAWWVVRACSADLRLAALRVGTRAETLQRLLAGEIIPGEELCYPIGSASGHTVLRLDWQRPAQGSWFEEPAARRLPRAA